MLYQQQEFFPFEAVPWFTKERQQRAARDRACRKWKRRTRKQEIRWINGPAVTSFLLSSGRMVVLTPLLGHFTAYIQRLEYKLLIKTYRQIWLGEFIITLCHLF